jgi:hypothetical protein
MDEQTIKILVFVAYILGVSAAVIWPYVNSRLKNPGLAFDWRYAVGQVVGGVAVFFGTLLASGKVPDLNEYITQGWYGILLAGVVGYGAARLGRETQRTNEARVERKKLNN